MKKTNHLLVLVAMLGFSTIISGQENLKKYYKWTNKAELSICDSAIVDAAKYYKKAFKHKKYAFAKDYYNAFICAAMTYDKKAVQKYYVGLRQFDYNTERSLKTKTASYISPVDWKALTDISVELVVDTIYRKKLDDLLELDQAIRHWASTKGRPGYYSTNADTIQYIDSINLKDLKETIINYGFPSEDKVGAEKSILQHPYYLIIKHNQMWNRLLGGDILKEAVISGKIHPNTYSELYDYMYDNFTTNLYGDSVTANEHYVYFPTFMVNNTILTAYYPNEKEINQFRAGIYLCTLDEARKKTAFQFGQKEHRFVLVTMNSFSCTEEEEKKLIARMKATEKYKKK